MAHGACGCVYTCIECVCVCRYMRHPRLAVVRDTIYTSADDIAHFLVIFVIIYLQAIDQYIDTHADSLYRWANKWTDRYTQRWIERQTDR